MFIKRGKYNIARVFLPDETYLDTATNDQIQSFLNNPAFQGKPISIMPDTHFGKGSCVGFTMPLNNYIIPNIVGVDIGCGVSTHNLGNSFDYDLYKIDSLIRNVVPIGFNIHKEQNEIKAGLALYNIIDNDLTPTHIYNLADEIGKSNKYLDFLNALGTLGGGNHFIEIGLGDSGNYYLTVHTGSRNLGLQVANYYQALAKELRFRVFDTSTELDFLPIGDGKNDFGDFDGSNYLWAMDYAQMYAQLNRKTIIQRILENVFRMDFSPEDYIESIHNYIGDNTIRKGAISAKSGERVIIPFNMEDGLILGYGKGNPDWNYSAPHGAGRILSRNKAKEQLNLQDAIDGMNSSGVFTTSLNKDTLDEAKGAYKSKDMIIEMIQETVEVTEFVKPIYNLKAGGD